MMAMSLLIRDARPDEAAELTELALRSKAYWGYGEEFLDRARPELTVTAEQVAAHPTVVAELDGRVAGMVRLTGTPPAAELDMLFVEPWAIGSGVGRALFSHAATLARLAGHTTMRIQADPGAEPFYRRMGALPAGEAISPSTGRSLPVLRYELVNPASAAEGSGGR
jgi:predicted N-acetyltransferase YhbS